MADYEEIAYAVETIRAAHLFYEYGKLDRLLEIGDAERDVEGRRWEQREEPPRSGCGSAL